jgi:hypothetical protein
MRPNPISEIGDSAPSRQFGGTAVASVPVGDGTPRRSHTAQRRHAKRRGGPSPREAFGDINDDIAKLSLADQSVLLPNRRPARTASTVD